MSDFNPRSGKAIIGLTLGLIFSLAFVLGPFIALMVFVPDVQPWIPITYWLFMVIYLLASATINVTPDTDNLGIGGTMINNPFSFEDDHNRAMLKVALFLWPGKVVCWTLGRTYSAIRGA